MVASSAAYDPPRELRAVHGRGAGRGEGRDRARGAAQRRRRGPRRGDGRPRSRPRPRVGRPDRPRGHRRPARGSPARRQGPAPRRHDVLHDGALPDVRGRACSRPTSRRSSTPSRTEPTAPPARCSSSPSTPPSGAGSRSSAASAATRSRSCTPPTPARCGFRARGLTAGIGGSPVCGSGSCQVSPGSRSSAHPASACPRTFSRPRTSCQFAPRAEIGTSCVTNVSPAHI